jgi:hypothetical protein
MDCMFNLFSSSYSVAYKRCKNSVGKLKHNGQFCVTVSLYILISFLVSLKHLS